MEVCWDANSHTCSHFCVIIKQVLLCTAHKRAEVLRGLPIVLRSLLKWFIRGDDLEKPEVWIS